MTWRLREEAKAARSGDKNSYSFVCTMRDVANAFPSMKHKALREVLEAGTDERTAVLLRSRHEQMEVKIATRGDGQVVIRPGCGGGPRGLHNVDGVQTSVRAEVGEVDTS